MTGRAKRWADPLPPGKVLSTSRGGGYATKKDRGGRVTNENVCAPGFQRFGFEPEPARAAPGSEPVERARSAAFGKDLRRCAA